MRNLAAVLAVIASPALATGIQVDVAGEGANGTFTIDLFEDVAPQHAERIATLAAQGAYDGVVFHRVIDGFMAQTGDVQYGKMGSDMGKAGRGGSDLPNLPAEFSKLEYDPGVVGMARSQNPNSANSQFFVMLDKGYFLNGQYTVVGKVTKGFDVVQQIKLGRGQNGSVIGKPDVMVKVTVVD